ncbi:MAG: hypothetical protein N2712_04370 [Brevinematales bacterium]|nr:hypothetical protein [Brevinematales bacterium]
MRAISVFLLLFFVQVYCIFAQVQSITDIVYSPVVTRDSILFIYTNQAKSVKIVLETEGWKPVSMSYDDRIKIWYYVYEKELKRGKYRYKLLVDNVFINDPLNNLREPDGIGSFFSVFELKNDIELFKKNPKHLGGNIYEFKYKNIDAQKVLISGSFNNWNPYELEMSRETGGVWRIKVYLPKGSHYYYFIVDDQITPDPLNPKTIRDKHGNIVNVLELN